MIREAVNVSDYAVVNPAHSTQGSLINGAAVAAATTAIRFGILLAVLISLQAIACYQLYSMDQALRRLVRQAPVPTI